MKTAHKGDDANTPLPPSPRRLPQSTMQSKNITAFSEMKQHNTIAPRSNLNDLSAATAASAKYRTPVWHREEQITKGKGQTFYPRDL